MFKFNNLCLYYELSTYFTPCFSVSIVNFVYVITGLVRKFHILDLSTLKLSSSKYAWLDLGHSNEVVIWVTWSFSVFYFFGSTLLDTHKFKKLLLFLQTSVLIICINVHSRPMKIYTAHKMKFSIKDFFSKFDHIRRFLRIWSHLLKKSLMENQFLCSANTFFVSF